MRLCYELDLEDSAVELIKDKVSVFQFLPPPMCSGVLGAVRKDVFSMVYYFLVKTLRERPLS